jgi:hypothetical protein
MNIHLSAIGWVTDAPQGNRLRWDYPLQALDGNGQYLGLPETVIVERAPVESRDLFQPPQASIGYPLEWWDSHGDITLASIVPLLAHSLPKPAQAVAFTWRGVAARIVFAAGEKHVARRNVTDGEHVYVEAAGIETILILGTHGTLENLRTLDLFADHGLDWRPLVEIGVAGSFGADLAMIAPRYEISPTMPQLDWQRLVDLANDGQASTPAQAEPGNLTDWTSFSLVLACRWEFALLAGFAFFDGPRTRFCELDQFPGDVLGSLPGTGMAYRVQDAAGRADRSNLVFCRSALAPPLNVPSTPVYINPEVRLHRPKSISNLVLTGALTLKGAMRHFSPVTQFDGDYGVRLTMRWQQPDPRAIGVEIDEIVSASAIAGSAPRRRQFLSRTRRPEDIPPQVSLARSFDVDFPDLTLETRARAIDAWDRVSAFSAWSPATPLMLRHEPEAPPLAFAAHDGGTVRITRAVGVAGVPNWEPDAFVSRVSGQLFIYRQTTAARTADGTFGTPVPTTDGLYRVTVSGVANLGDFVGGSFTVGGFTENIRTVSGVEIYFRADKTSFAPGSGRLVQDNKLPALWTKVAAFPIANLPTELVFNDPLPAPAGGSAVEPYCARLAFFGRLGPASNIVHAVRIAPVPGVPPPFTVEILGNDYFHRTMLKVRFTTPVSSGRFRVWWAPGVVGAGDLARIGASGHYGGQEAQMGAVLYDVLALPIPQHVGRAVTIGVQRVSEGGLQSDFTTVAFVIPPLVS